MPRALVAGCMGLLLLLMLLLQSETGTPRAASSEREAGTPSAASTQRFVRVEPGPLKRLPGDEVGRRGSTVPPAAASVYLKSTRPDVLASEGCQAGRHAAASAGARDGLVVLAFGRPMKRHATFGTSLFRAGFRSTIAIGRAATAFAGAFAECAPADAHLELGIGTSNYGPQVSYGTGRAWALMVNGAAGWARAHGIADRVDVVGANDIEMGWASPHLTRRWIEGYTSAAARPYLDFGDAGGCPPVGDCLGQWTVEDVWYAAWGASPAIPLPEIYTPNGTMARQWAYLSRYAVEHHGYPMRIVGALSEREACRQSADSCRGIDATPARAWTLLSHALNADRRTAQGLRWSTDLRWNDTRP